MDRRVVREAAAIAVLALVGRLLAVVVTTTTQLNPYSLYDADEFAAAADQAATAIAAGSLPAVEFGRVVQVWGAMLSPFWLLPGPSRIYARLGVAVLGTLAVYNVYVVARHYHSRFAARVVVVPLLAYPSFLFIHAAIIREAAVLVGLTTAARLLLAPSERLGAATKYAAVVLALAFAFVLRPENLPVYVLVLGVGAFLASRVWTVLPGTSRLVSALGALALPIVAYPSVRALVDRLATVRRKRARGRTEYLPTVVPDTLPEAVAFSWVGALYFLFSPFPWTVSIVADFVVAVEALCNLVYALFAVHGARVLATRTVPGSVALVAGVAVGSLLYGLGTANVGTAVRHRQMVLWAIFLLGGIGVANLIDLGEVSEP